MRFQHTVRCERAKTTPGRELTIAKPGRQYTHSIIVARSKHGDEHQKRELAKRSQPYSWDDPATTVRTIILHYDTVAVNTNRSSLRKTVAPKPHAGIHGHHTRLSRGHSDFLSSLSSCAMKPRDCPRARSTHAPHYTLFHNTWRRCQLAQGCVTHGHFFVQRNSLPSSLRSKAWNVYSRYNTGTNVGCNTAAVKADLRGRVS